jgi:hypothetical protein
MNEARPMRDRLYIKGDQTRAVKRTGSWLDLVKAWLAAA